VQNPTSYSFSATPISYDKISRLSRLVFQIWRGTDRRQTQRPKHKALTLTVVSLKCKMADYPHFEQSKRCNISAKYCQFCRNLARWCISALWTHQPIKFWDFKNPILQTAAILKIQKNHDISKTVWQREAPVDGYAPNLVLSRSCWRNHLWQLFGDRLWRGVRICGGRKFVVSIDNQKFSPLILCCRYRAASDLRHFAWYRLRILIWSTSVCIICTGRYREGRIYHSALKATYIEPHLISISWQSPNVLC